MGMCRQASRGMVEGRRGESRERRKLTLRLLEAGWHDFPKSRKNGTVLDQFWYTFFAKALYSLHLERSWFVYHFGNLCTTLVKRFEIRDPRLEARHVYTWSRIPGSRVANSHSPIYLSRWRRKMVTLNSGLTASRIISSGTTNRIMTRVLWKLLKKDGRTVIL